MLSPRTVCFVYFALLFGLPHVEVTNTTQFPSNATMNSSTISITSAPHHISVTEKQKSISATAKLPVCTPASPKNNPPQQHCIFFLPTGNPLVLTVVALIVAVLALLLITLMCACKVCHLRGIISSFQPRHNNIDLRSIRENSKSAHRNEGQADGQPTENCVMLSEVTAGQEESREHEENNTGEMKDTEQPSTEPPVKDPNGDVTQENSHAPDARAAESSDTGV